MNKTLLEPLVNKEQDPHLQHCFHLLARIIKIEETLQTIDLIQPFKLGLSNFNDTSKQNQLMQSISNTLFGTLDGQNGRLETLQGVSEQIVMKVREMDQTLGNLLNYGQFNFEPWRHENQTQWNELYLFARRLEVQMNSTNEGCAILENKVAKLELENVNLNQENLLLRSQLEYLNEKLKESSMCSSPLPGNSHNEEYIPTKRSLTPSAIYLRNRNHSRSRQRKN